MTASDTRLGDITTNNGNTVDDTDNKNNAVVTFDHPVVSSHRLVPPTLPRRQPSTHMDVDTGRTTTRFVRVTKVDETEREACSAWDKFKKGATSAVTKDEEEQEEGKDDSNSEKEKENHKPEASSITAPGARSTQFRIQSHHRGGNHTHTMFPRLTSLVQSKSSAMTNDTMAWTFRVSFWKVTLAAFLCFMGLVVLFAAFIYGAGRIQPGCLYVGDGTFARSFMDAYHLSWTTFSTVGYGVMGPTTATSERRCIAINIVLAYESFMGVLFAGLAGAVVIGKVARIQSIAQVRFSHPICVRYGTGVMDSSADSDDDDDNDNSPGLPCPVLEFRMANELSGEKGGEIMNASVTVVASILTNDDENSKVLRVGSTHANHHDKQCTLAGKAAKAVAGRAAHAGSKAVATGATVAKATLLGAGKRASAATGTFIQKLNHAASRSESDLPNTELIDEEPYKEESKESLLEKKIGERFLKVLEKKRKEIEIEEARRVAVDEGNAMLAPPRVYYKLNIETDSHPFFKRVWIIRHILDETSPLLSGRARQMIADNHGTWPEDMNSAESVRKHVRFNDIIVSFSGTANVSGSSVYAQKVYDYVDMNIGYSFANVLILQKSRLLVDIELLNDVKEQNGGGAEPLELTDKNQGTDFEM